MCQRHSFLWIILLLSLIFKINLCYDYTDVVDFSNIYTQFVNEEFTSLYFYCKPWEQKNVTYNGPKIKISGLCKYHCEMYITANNSITINGTNVTFVPTDILEQIIATKIVDKDYFLFTSSIHEVDFYVYVINNNKAKSFTCDSNNIDNQLTITYSCENPITPSTQPFGFAIGLTIIIFLLFVCGIIILFGIVFLIDCAGAKLYNDK